MVIEQQGNHAHAPAYNTVTPDGAYKNEIVCKLCNATVAVVYSAEMLPATMSFCSAHSQVNETNVAIMLGVGQ